ncbi:mariner transposase [Trichonephila clavipes]|nr:mariner transposase [Trichonephila clavipes]
MSKPNGSGISYWVTLRLDTLYIVNVFSESVKMEKSDHRYAIQYFYLKDLSPTNIKAELDSILGESVPSFITVKYWVTEFKRGYMSCQDEHCSGRPNEVTTPERIKYHKVVLDVHRLKKREVEDIVGISKSEVHRILSGNSD